MNSRAKHSIISISLIIVLSVLALLIGGGL